MTKSIIYETKGRAREFSELAINLFTGCDHRCIYCYGAAVTHQDKAKFENEPRPRVTPAEIFASAKSLVDKGEKRRVLLCFVTDPYQKSEEANLLTMGAIVALHQAGLGVVILTKGGRRSMRDFPLLGPKDAYATTLTLTDAKRSLEWEPGAAVPAERIEALREAHNRGIETWVSFEPVIYPEETFELLEMTHGFVGHYKVGTMNYHPQGQKTNWAQYGTAMLMRLNANGEHYYFKKDLVREMGINWEAFQQNWVCR